MNSLNKIGKYKMITIFFSAKFAMRLESPLTPYFPMNILLTFLPIIKA